MLIALCRECNEEGRIWAKGLCHRCYDRLWWRQKHNSLGRKSKDLNQKRRWSYQRRFGISLEEYEELYASQNGACAICSNTHSRLDVDHNHSTGKIRGLLCRACNTLVGQVEKRWDYIVKAKQYLEATNG